MRSHGRNGRLYVDIAGGGSAALLPFVTEWSFDLTTDKQDVTAQGDTNKTYVVGLPDATGSYSGWVDAGAANLFAAATDGIARKFYAYVDIVNAAAHYIYGTAFFDFSLSSGVAAANAMSGSITAASTITQKTS